jgi:hypothetical protein
MPGAVIMLLFLGLEEGNDEANGAHGEADQARHEHVCEGENEEVLEHEGFFSSRGLSGLL